MVLIQMAQNSTLLSEELKTAILRGSMPSLEDIVTALLISALDCHFSLFSDNTATWNEKRLSRAVLTTSFLSALALARGMEQAPEKTVNAVPGESNV